MHVQNLWLDQGQAFENVGSTDSSPCLRVAVISRLGSLSVCEGQESFWLVLRGKAQLDCREGQFPLQSGDWFALDRDSKPSLLASRTAIVLALTLPSFAAATAAHVQMPAVFPGRGRASLRDKRLALRHWRQAGAFRALQVSDAGNLMMRLLSLVSGLQDGFSPLVQKCPGKSLRRKRQVFARMQRARLYLDGNLGRTVSLSELAHLSNFSTWYFTKTFHALYDEGPRDVTALLRLRQGAQLLLDSDLSIGEISAACGFEHACSFARAFRTHYGMSATQFKTVAPWKRTPIHVQRTDSRANARLSKGT